MSVNPDMKTISLNAWRGLGCLTGGGVACASAYWVYANSIIRSDAVPLAIAAGGVYAMSQGITILTEDVVSPIKAKANHAWKSTKEWLSGYNCRLDGVLASSAVTAGVTMTVNGQYVYGPLLAVGAGCYLARTETVKKPRLLGSTTQPSLVIKPDTILHFDGPFPVKSSSLCNIIFESTGAAYEACKYKTDYLGAHRERFEGVSAAKIRTYENGSLKSGYEKPAGDAPDSEQALYKTICAQLLENLLSRKFGIGVTSLEPEQDEARQELLKTKGKLKHPAVADFSEEQITAAYRRIYDKVRADNENRQRRAAATTPTARHFTPFQ